jgi:hypothetical protein
MEYENVVLDFARRTRQNLTFVRQAARDTAQGGTHPRSDVYEVTQLINSMLGLLVFPQQRYFDAIPETPLPELVSQGWPMVKASAGFPDVATLRDVLRYLRNAIAHFNVEFLAPSGTLEGIRVWNTHKGEKTWQAELSLHQLDQLTDRFITAIEDWTSADMSATAQHHNRRNRPHHD